MRAVKPICRLCGTRPADLTVVKPVGLEFYCSECRPEMDQKLKEWK